VKLLKIRDKNKKELPEIMIKKEEIIKREKINKEGMKDHELKVIDLKEKETDLEDKEEKMMINLEPKLPLILLCLKSLTKKTEFKNHQKKITKKQ